MSPHDWSDLQRKMNGLQCSSSVYPEAMLEWMEIATKEIERLKRELEERNAAA